MFRLNFWAQSLVSPAGLPLADTRYGCLPSVPPVLPPPPMSMLYTSPAAGLAFRESHYRRPLIGFSDESEKSSPELREVLGGVAGVESSLHAGRQQLGDSVAPTAMLCGRTPQVNMHPSLLLHTQLEAALCHYQQQQQQQRSDDDGAADSESRARHCTARRQSPSLSSEMSAFRQPRRRRTTPQRGMTDSGAVQQQQQQQALINGLHAADCRTTSAVARLHCTEHDRSPPPRKTGKQ